MRRIIFLDIDGVLATGEVVKDGLWTFTPRCVNQFRRVLDAHPNAEVVVSSSWRMHTIAETKEHLLTEGLPAAIVDRISGVTIRAYHYMVKGAAVSIPRGVEIKQWIDHNVHSGGNGEYELGRNGTFERKFLGLDFTYVILDDDSDMLLEQRDYFVRCMTRKGLTRKLADKAISRLNG